MTLKSLAAAALGAVVIALSTTSPIAAAPVTVNFSVGEFSGKFYGLDDAISDNQMASSYDLIGEVDSFLGISTDNTQIDDRNEFSFTQYGGVSFKYRDRAGFRGVAGTVGVNGIRHLYSIDLESWRAAGLIDQYAMPTVRGAMFWSVTPVAAVPLPAGAVLLLSGLAAISGLKRRNDRAA